MILDDLLRRLANQGVTLNLEGGQLRYRGPIGALTQEFRAAIATHRTAIIGQLLKASAPAGVRQRCVTCDHRGWVDDAPQNGRVRTTCGKCGRFIGYRPVSPENASELLDVRARTR